MRLGGVGRGARAGCVLGAVLSLPLACGTTPVPDGSGGGGADGDSGGSAAGGTDGGGGSSSGGSPSGGSPSGGGPASGGSADGGHAGQGGLGGAEQCPEDLGGEEYCTSAVEYYEQCTNPDSTGVYEQCVEDDTMFDRMDPCILAAAIECNAPCTPDLYNCRQAAIAETHPELVNEELFLLCLEGAPIDVDCSSNNLVEGVQLACLERAQDCGAVDDYCISANVVRPEFLPERDACLAGPCEDLEQCLYDVIYGATP